MIVVLKYYFPIKQPEFFGEMLDSSLGQERNDMNLEYFVISDS